MEHSQALDIQIFLAWPLCDYSVLTLKNLHKSAHKYKLVCILEPCFIKKRNTDRDLTIPTSSTKKEVLF